MAVYLVSEYGIEVVGIRDGNHLRRMDEWAEMTTNLGVLTFAFVKTEAS